MNDHFDWEYYVNSYEDLKNGGIKTEKAAFRHWNKHGREEGRICLRIPDYFDWLYYISTYPDLKDISSEMIAYEHYINYGEKEGRKCNNMQIIHNLQKVPILYISLPGDEERKNYIQKQIKPLCNSEERICKLIDGVWGKDPKTGKIHKDYNDNFVSSNISYSEFGCTMAHINAAKFIIDNKLPYALVIEDDANFDLMKDWPKTLEQIVLEIPKGWTTCQLYFSGNSDKNNSGVQKKSKLDPGYGTVAYLLSSKGAYMVSKIDISTYTKSLIADVFMYNFSGAKPYVHYPRYIITGEMASKIHPDHDELNKEQVENIIEEIKKSYSEQSLLK